MKHNRFLLRFYAFSLIELMISLITISCITAAFAPIITKKMKNSNVTITGGGSSEEVMEMMCANMFGDNCIRCTKECTKCTTTHYLTPEKTCSSCQAGYFCDGTSSTMPCSTKFGSGCTTCNSTKCLVVSSGYYINNDGYSISCASQYDPYCASCNSTQCNSCKTGYAFNSNRQCIATCAAGSREFTSAGTFTFDIPNGCTSITATLVAGGGGGGAGSIKQVNADFSAVGTTNWSIPSYARSKAFKLYACGGGGASSSTDCGYKKTNSGGYGGFVNGVVRTMPNQTALSINIGAGGIAQTSHHYAGGGGGATYISNFASDSEAVAGGGSGGGCTCATSGRCNNSGAGGGANTANGGASVVGCCFNQGNPGKPINIAVMTSYFGTYYCAPGSRSSLCCDCGGVNGNPGYLRIYYPEKNKGASGGSAGAIVAKQTISVTGKLTIIVGAGGAGGTIGGYNSSGEFIQSTNGSKGGQSMIKNSSGAIVLQTATGNNTGGDGGNSSGTGTSGGIVTNGKNTSPVSVAGFYASGASAATGTTGTSGGTTTIEGANYCSGGGGSSATGGNAPNYGGCGGGGGGAGYNGGKGAPGYVKLEWGNG